MDAMQSGPIPGGNAVPSETNTKLTPGPRQYELDGRDRMLLPMTLGMGILLAELFIFLLWGGGLIVPVSVAAWYAIYFWYRGIARLAGRSGLFLLAAVCLLSLSFAIYSNMWLRFWNVPILAVLLCIQLFEGSTAARAEWSRPSMLGERFALTLGGMFGKLGAPFQAIFSLKKEGHRRFFYVLGALTLSLILLLVAVPLLASADALFRHLTDGLVRLVDQQLASWLARLLAGACIAPLLYSLLYTLRRPDEPKEKVRMAKAGMADPVVSVIVLAVMDCLYAFFLVVQSAALFGGERYLAAAGVSFAEYARSGFFQLVAVAALNLTLVMACIQISPRVGRGWRWVGILSTVLIGESLVLLVSAAWRMTLYVGRYGLSLRRFLTYWGMAMLLIFFAGALFKIWKAGFSFFRVFFAAGVAGWLVLNFCNADYWIARCNVALYESGQIEAADLYYLSYLSYDALPVVEELAENLPHSEQILRIVDSRRTEAKAEAADWRTWSVSAQLAGR